MYVYIMNAVTRRTVKALMDIMKNEDIAISRIVDG